MKFKDFLTKANNFLNEKVRPWIDGEEVDDILVDSNSNRNEAEDFLAKVAQIIASLMEENKFVIPNGKVYLPSEYIVYLSPEKDKEWQGRKRQLFIEGLEVLSYEYASSICGKTSVDLIPIKVEIRIDGTLKGNSTDFKVKTVLDETSSTTNDFDKSEEIVDVDKLPMSDDEKTVVYDQEETVVYDEEKTVIEMSPLYYLEIYQGNMLYDKIPITKAKLEIGRPSRISTLDIELPNKKISRHHITLFIDNEKRIWLTHKGQNPTKIEGIACTNNIKTLVKYNQNIEIEDFILIARN